MSKMVSNRDNICSSTTSPIGASSSATSSSLFTAAAAATTAKQQQRSFTSSPSQYYGRRQHTFSPFKQQTTVMQQNQVEAETTVDRHISTYADADINGGGATAAAALHIISPMIAAATADKGDDHLSSSLLDMRPVTKKSYLDIRQYAHFTMPHNGLQVMLVSDPETTSSAASMDVHVGYMHDPPDVPGLMHFCEHMLFLGTENYPDESDYKQYLSRHGGNSNAETGAEHTTYYFNVNSDHFRGALSRFAAFFICPLFTESATDREMRAVDAEHRRNLHFDNRRIFRVMKMTGNERNPFNKFSTGNIETLTRYPVEQLRRMLLEKHAKHYTAENMKLVLVGRESLSELQQVAMEMFAPVKGDISRLQPPFALRTSPPPLDSLSYGPLYHEHQLRKVHKIIPVEDFRSLSLYWEIPSQFANYRRKPLFYITHLLEQQANGSIYQYLKNEKNWINSISAGPYSTTTVQTVYKITLSLTKDGLQHTDEIVRDVFEMLHVIKMSLLSDDKRGSEIYREVSLLFDISFRYLEKSGTIGYAKTLSRRIQQFPAEESLYAPFGLLEYDPEAIEGILDMLSPRHMRMYIVAKEYEQQYAGEKEQELLLTDDIYGTKFAEEDIPASVIQDLSALHNSRKATSSRFQLPPVNEFIAENFDIREQLGTAPNHPEIGRAHV